MKNATAIATLAMTATSLVAETLRIGAFNLPYRFEDTNITDIVRHVVTNDVIAYKSATTSFTPPFVEENGNVTVDSENTPGTTLYLPPVFENGIEFRIEDGQTNCIIRQSQRPLRASCRLGPTLSPWRKASLIIFALG